MSQLLINDLEFCETAISNSKVIQGSAMTGNQGKGLWNWDVIFGFDFDHNGISSFSQGYFSGFAFAIGGFVINSNGKKR